MADPKHGNVLFHPWELAGVGRAPYRLLWIKEYPSSCAVCGRRIKRKVVVEDIDGKIFGVGAGCVKKLDLLGSDTARLKREVHRAMLANRRGRYQRKRLGERLAREKEKREDPRGIF